MAEHDLIAKTMLGRMEYILAGAIETGVADWNSLAYCMLHLDNSLRSLAKHQRQKWVCLLVRTLRAHLVFPDECLLPVVGHLELLWRADDNPRQTYAEAERELLAFCKTVAVTLDANVRSRLNDLLLGAC